MTFGAVRNLPSEPTDEKYIIKNPNCNGKIGRLINFTAYGGARLMLESGNIVTVAIDEIERIKDD